VKKEMDGLQLYLFDDARARQWQPFALTRPVGELMLGAHTFRARAERVLGTPCRGHITAGHLQGFDEPGAARVIAPESIDTALPRLYLSSRVVLDWGAELAPPAEPAVIVVDGSAAGWFAPAGSAAPEPGWLQEPSVAGQVVELPGRVLDNVWDLVSANAGQLVRDHEAAAGSASAEAAAATPDGFEALAFSPGSLRLGRNVVVEPNVVLDFSEGPIRLDDDVTVRAFTRLAGPAYVGPGSTLLGGPYSGISIGPVCKVHGEMEETVVLGYSNKAHDGFLGHAYLGRWVNLGAMTTNSDLKNNYGRIRMWTPGGDADTGLMKLGCLLGDHVKTGIGALLNTGTVVGAGSNLWGTELPPKYVPPFSWGSGSELVAYDADRFLEVAETVMGRRGQSLSDGMRRVLREAWRLGREQA
jgi:UDP-N-acetylglucosamine diphosphorylase / glucose-1-phosphate thymidylyltransferase / UDP-N-acetylgalactosamine diphosphorylase / glucosamine-1-phosphate N-acetyltransferase / galactosamine-1-phosphate N-acetyltransferase